MRQGVCPKRRCSLCRFQFRPVSPTVHERYTGRRIHERRICQPADRQFEKRRESGRFRIVQPHLRTGYRRTDSRRLQRHWQYRKRSGAGRSCKCRYGRIQRSTNCRHSKLLSLRRHQRSDGERNGQLQQPFRRVQRSPILRIV